MFKTSNPFLSFFKVKSKFLINNMHNPYLNELLLMNVGIKMLKFKNMNGKRADNTFIEEVF